MEEGHDLPEDDPPPRPPHCHIPVGQPRGDPCPREGAPCCPLRRRSDLGLDSEELGQLTCPPEPRPDLEAHMSRKLDWTGQAFERLEQGSLQGAPHPHCSGCPPWSLRAREGVSGV